VPIYTRSLRMSGVTNSNASQTESAGDTGAPDLSHLEIGVFAPARQPSVPSFQVPQGFSLGSHRPHSKSLPLCPERSRRAGAKAQAVATESPSSIPPQNKRPTCLSESNQIYLTNKLPRHVGYCASGFPAVHRRFENPHARESGKLLTAFPWGPSQPSGRQDECAVRARGRCRKRSPPSS